MKLIKSLSKTIGSTKPIKNQKSKIVNCIQFVILLIFVVPYIYGQSINDSAIIQHRIESLITQDKKIMQEINNSGRSDWEQMRKQYETMRFNYYRRLSVMGDPAAAVLLKSAGSGNATSTPRTGFDYYVSTTGDNINGDGSINAPFQTIQRAIDETQQCSKSYIKIEDGIYKECIEIPVVTSISLVGNDYNPKAVVIDGAGEGTVISIDYFGGLHINGITITGASNGNQPVINLENSWFETLNVIISNNTSNKAIIGTAESYPWYGTGIGVTLINTVICGNTVDVNSGDGIIAAGFMSLNMHYCTIADNTASKIIWNNYESWIYNSIIYNPLSDVEIAGNTYSTFIDYCNLRDCFLDGSTSIYAAIEGMIDVVPGFVAPQLNLYQLADDSPCIDAGNPNLYNAHIPPARGMIQSDMGAYGGPYVSEQEYQVVSPSPIINGPDTICDSE